MIKSANEFVDGYTLIEYEFSTLCDKSCSYCYNLVDHEKRFAIPHQQILDDISAILQCDNPYIILGLIGGETLLLPQYNEIIDHIYKLKKPETKIILFTHADYPFEYFKEKIDKLKIFGNNVKVTCTLHWENLNREQFSKNLKYVHDTFKYKVMYFLLTDKFLNEQEYVDSLLENCPETKLASLKLDSCEGIDLFKQVSYYKKIEKYSSRMDNTIQIDSDKYPYNIGMYEIYKKYKYCFEGKECTLVDYDLDKDGNVRMCCNGEIIFNVREEFPKDILNPRTLICKEKKCMDNFGILLVNN